jgi:hypothetical protein
MIVRFEPSTNGLVSVAAGTTVSVESAVIPSDAVLAVETEGAG